MGRVNETCYVGDNVGLVGHRKVFLGGYLGHLRGDGDGGVGRRGRERGTFKKKEITAGEYLSPLSSNYSLMDNYPTSNSNLIETLNLQKHSEGGYFVETNRQPVSVPSPFAGELSKGWDDVARNDSENDGQMANRGHWQPRSITC